MIAIVAPNEAPAIVASLIAQARSPAAILGGDCADIPVIETAIPAVDVLLSHIRDLFRHSVESDLTSGPILSDHHALHRYLALHMAHAETEHFRVLYLNGRNELLADEIAARGSVSQVSPYPAEIMKRALELRSTAMILVHNHPSGSLRPSNPDKTLTTVFRRACDLFGIVLHDHLIVARTGIASLRAAGLLDAKPR